MATPLTLPPPTGSIDEPERENVRLISCAPIPETRAETVIFFDAPLCFLLSHAIISGPVPIRPAVAHDVSSVCSGQCLHVQAHDVALCS